MAVTLELLAEAESAYHALMTGRAVAEFRDQNGESVKYTVATQRQLGIYIIELKRQLGLLTEGVGPMRAWF